MNQCAMVFLYCEPTRPVDLDHSGLQAESPPLGNSHQGPRKVRKQLRRECGWRAKRVEASERQFMKALEKADKVSLL